VRDDLPTYIDVIVSKETGKVESGEIKTMFIDPDLRSKVAKDIREVIKYKK